MQMPERFTRLIVMNTAIATGGGLGEGFAQWRAFSNSQANLDIAKLFLRGHPNLPPNEAAAYNLPYPDITFKAAIRKFPNMVPDHPNAPGALFGQQALQWWSQEWEGESFMAVGSADPVLGLPAMQALRRVIRGCPEPMVIPEAGHFLQEWGESIASVALAYFERK
jgi:haloalkane dehalogenase